MIRPSSVARSLSISGVYREETGHEEALASRQVGPDLDITPPAIGFRPGPREIRGVQADSGEAGGRRGLATLGEGIPRRFTESRAGQREEAGDQLR